jgi:hypothetical protein
MNVSNVQTPVMMADAPPLMVRRIGGIDGGTD